MVDKVKSYDEEMLERWKMSIDLYNHHLNTALDNLFTAKERLDNAKKHARELEYKIRKQNEN